MIVKLSFDKNWIFSNGGVNSLSVQKFLSQCRSQYGAQINILEQYINCCTLDLTVACSPDELKAQLNSILCKDILGGRENNGIFQLDVQTPHEAGTPAAAENNGGGKKPLDIAENLRQYLAQQKQKDGQVPAASRDDTERPVCPAADPAAEQASAAPVDDASKAVLEKIARLTGAEAFKQLCDDIHTCAALVRENRTQQMFFANTYLFSINVGEGHSCALELLADLLAAEGIFEERGKVTEIELPAFSDPEASAKLQHLQDALGNGFDSPRVVSLDISSWLYHTGGADFKQLLLYIFRHNIKNVIVFRIPFVAANTLRQTRQDLSDLLSVSEVVFPPFTPDELREIAEKMVAEAGFTAEDSVWPSFSQLISEEKKDGFFYGIHTVRKLVNEMIRCEERACAQTGSSARHITGAAVASMMPEPGPTDDSALKELDKLVGMDPIKVQIMEIVNQISISRTQGMSFPPCMHMRFVGNPGTGKTTVARILGRILNENGVLRIGKFYEHRGRDLCGSYVGQTAPRTAAICQEAYGSVLFIDEAYSLFRGDGSTVDYGREAIDTLIAEMENHSDDLVVIFAGYPEDMDILLRANAGMASRIPYTLTFPNYTREQLAQIFFRMIPDRFPYNKDFADSANQYFLSLPDFILESPDFGNARFVRNLYERVWGKAAMRCQGADSIRLTSADLAAAIQSADPGMLKNTPRKIGFH
ncbi:MAG: AAA family ATPase [Clostridiaceae bacterium]|nr:AAA family ATPase [Clostridiaceae bacterium]